MDDADLVGPTRRLRAYDRNRDTDEEILMARFTQWHPGRGSAEDHSQFRERQATGDVVGLARLCHTERITRRRSHLEHAARTAGGTHWRPPRLTLRGGRAVISDITCDEPVPQRLRDDPTLWSGCVSGAFLESEFLEEFERAGFSGVQIVNRQAEPWCVLEGMEFRSMTVRAYNGKGGPCMDHKQAVVYQGPWKSVVDDDTRSEASWRASKTPGTI